MREEQLLNFDFRRYFEALRKYVWALLALLALSIAAGVVYTSRQPRVYEAVASVQIEPRLADLLNQGTNQDARTGQSAGGLDYYKQQRQVIASFMLIRATVRDKQLYTHLLTEDELKANPKVEAQIDLAAHRLQENLRVEYPDQDRIMYIVVRSGDPVRAAKIANDHLASYIAYSKHQLKMGTEDASGALKTELDDTETNLTQSEAALFQFQKDKGLLAVSLEDQLSLVSMNITSFTQKMNEARARRIEIGARLERMRKLSTREVLESPILVMNDSTSFDALRAQYYTERNQFLQVQKELGPKNPEYQKSKAKMDDLYAALHAETQRIIEGVEEQHQAALGAERLLNVEVERYKKEALDLGPTIVDYNKLVRNNKRFEDDYKTLRPQLAASQMTGRLNTTIDTSYAKPLDPALPPTEPVSPSLKINLMVAVAIALMIDAGLLVLVVFLDRSIKSTLDAQAATGVPVLGVIPMLPPSTSPEDNRARDLYVHEHPTSSIAECCRSLRTNILFSGADRQLKTLVVSSAGPREGKTTSVIYLGTTMAQSHQRVLLVDTDMRRPRLHQSMGVPKHIGLSNLILGDQNYDDVIKTTDIPNLFVLPCGPRPPNPAELLMTKRFETVLQELSSRFDLVILDSPPLQAVTDAVVLSKYTDGVILVVRSGKTLRDEIRHSANQIRDVGGSIFGVIVNEFDVSDRNYGYYNYYGYGEQDEAKVV
ncbi:MAG: polysaccharide biosynthesis tyrosine autokinase [Myxococcota bacterium]|nr:polysaccharide biosynthesis tyrosine autokinase [Myxococcota bacterium]